MWKYTLERIILIFFTAFIILSVTYLLMKLLPVSSPAGQVSDQLRFYQQQVNLGYMEVIPYNLKDTAQITLLDPQTGKEYYFSYKPVLEQYGSWIYNIFTQWNWGVSSSIAPGQDIMSIIAVRLPYSIKINIYATLIDVPVGFGLGIWAAVKKNKLTDSIISTLVMIFISVPSFVLVSFLISLFGYQLKWLPTTWPSDSTSDVRARFPTSSVSRRIRSAGTCTPACPTRRKTPGTPSPTATCQNKKDPFAIPPPGSRAGTSGGIAKQVRLPPPESHRLAKAF